MMPSSSAPSPPLSRTLCPSRPGRTPRGTPFLLARLWVKDPDVRNAFIFFLKAFPTPANWNSFQKVKNVYFGVDTNVIILFLVTSQLYETHILPESVIVGNDALLKCAVPSFVADFVTITAWMDSEGNEFQGSTRLLQSASHGNNCVFFVFICKPCCCCF